MHITINWKNDYNCSYIKTKSSLENNEYIYNNVI